MRKNKKHSVLEVCKAKHLVNSNALNEKRLDLVLSHDARVELKYFEHFTELVKRNSLDLLLLLQYLMLLDASRRLLVHWKSHEWLIELQEVVWVLEVDLANFRQEVGKVDLRHHTIHQIKKECYCSSQKGLIIMERNLLKSRSSLASKAFLFSFSAVQIWTSFLDSYFKASMKSSYSMSAGILFLTTS